MRCRTLYSHVYAHVCSHVNTLTCLSTAPHTCLCTCLHTCLYTCLHACLRTCAHTCRYTCQYTCLHTCLRHVNTLVHTDPHICTCADRYAVGRSSTGSPTFSRAVVQVPANIFVVITHMFLCLKVQVECSASQGYCNISVVTNMEHN